VAAALGLGYYYMFAGASSSSSSSGGRGPGARDERAGRPSPLQKPTGGDSTGNVRGPLTTPPSTPTTSSWEGGEEPRVEGASESGREDQGSLSVPVADLRALWEDLPKAPDGSVSRANLAIAIKTAPHLWGPLLGVAEVHCVKPPPGSKGRAKRSKFAIDWTTQLVADIDMSRDGFIEFKELIAYSIQHGRV